MRGVFATVMAGILLLAACGEVSVVGPGFAAPDQLTGPWRPTPLLLNPTTRESIATTCRRDMERKPTSAVAVIDARGLSVAVVRMTGDSAGACDALELSANGNVTGAGGGWRQDGVETLAALGDTEIQDVQVGQVGGGALKAEGWSVMGRAGPAIESVVVETPGQPQILATLDAGWFAAWWPAKLPDPNLAQPMPREVPYIVRGYDATGDQVTEVGN